MSRPRPQTVWFGRGVSNNVHAIRLIKAADLEGRFETLASHVLSEAAGLQVADRSLVETPPSDPDDYVAQCLQIAREQRVAAFFPGRELSAIARQGQQFAAECGTRVMLPGDAGVIATLENKSRLYRSLAEVAVPVPDHVSVSTIESFDQAYAGLRQRHGMACIKPEEGVYALGFKVIHEHLDPYHELMNTSLYRIRLEDLRRALGSRVSFGPLLVMEYLDGPEYSVDCYARQGELIYAIPRLKLRLGQRIDADPGLHRLARGITEHFNFNGLFNIQIKVGGGVPKCIEVNPRLSGGIGIACKSGVNLPYIALREALDERPLTGLPNPRFGLTVADYPEYIDVR
ncbi:MAG: ATP-grasp domain-containing protein [Gammaproteobacteria bacterium]